MVPEPVSSLRRRLHPVAAAGFVTEVLYMGSVTRRLRDYQAVSRASPFSVWRILGLGQRHRCRHWRPSCARQVASLGPRSWPTSAKGFCLSLCNSVRNCGLSCWIKYAGLVFVSGLSGNFFPEMAVYVFVSRVLPVGVPVRTVIVPAVPVRVPIGVIISPIRVPV